VCVVNVQEWHLLEHPAWKDSETRQGLEFPRLIFKLRILRRPLTYTYLLIIPCVLLSVLNLVIFWLPPEAPAKMMLGTCQSIDQLTNQSINFLSLS
jgi:hypothetical protein